MKTAAFSLFTKERGLPERDQALLFERNWGRTHIRALSIGQCAVPIQGMASDHLGIWEIG